MKKRLYILLAILAACFIACNGEKNIEVPPPYDPAWVGRYVWKNESTHAITMSVFGDVDFRNKLLPAGGEITVEKDAIAYVPTLEEYMLEGMSIVFDEGPYGGAFEGPSVANDPQPSLRDEENYEHEAYEDYHMPHWGEDVYVDYIEIWTYTFTDEVDYAAAVARGPLPQFEGEE